MGWGGASQGPKGRGWGGKVFPIMRGGAGMEQDNTIRGGDEDPILRPRLAPLPSLKGSSLKWRLEVRIYFLLKFESYLLDKITYQNALFYENSL